MGKEQLGGGEEQMLTLLFTEMFSGVKKPKEPSDGYTTVQDKEKLKKRKKLEQESNFFEERDPL